MALDDESNFRLIAEYSADVIGRLDLDMRYTYVSPSCIPVLGWTPEEIRQMGPLGPVVPEDRPALTEIALRNLTPGVKPSRGTFRVKKKDGTIIWVEASPNIVRDPATQAPIETVLVIRDITERVLLEQKLSTLALTDGLTGLANRRAFDDALNREWARTQREDSQLTLLMMDIDNLKQLNDNYGHGAGDDCLRLVAGAVTTSLRASDTAARYGGDEIVAILPATNIAGGVEAAARVRAEIDRLSISVEDEDGNPISIFARISAGVAMASAGNYGKLRMPDGLLKAADNALYQAKNAGRDTISTAFVAMPAANAEETRQNDSHASEASAMQPSEG